MKKIIVLTLFIVSYSFAISLDHVIKLAVKNSPYLKEKKVDVDISKYQEKVNSAKRFGKISAFGSYFRYEDKRILYPISPPINPKNLVGAKNQFILGVNYTVPVFVGFKNIENVEIAKLHEKIANINYSLAKNQLIFNIKNLYSKILELQRQKVAFNSYLKALNKLKNDIKLAVKLGKKPKVDILKVNYEIENTKSQIHSLQNNINSLKYALKTLVGVENLDLTNLEDIKPESVKRVSINNLKKLEKLDFLKKEQAKKVKIAKGEYLPDIYLIVSAQRNMGADTYKDIWQIGIKVNFTLFDFGKRKANYLREKLKLSKINIKKKIKLLEIKKQLQEGFSRLKTAESKLEASQQQLKFAQKIEQIEKIKYQEGVSDLYNYLYAKTQKIMAESNVYRWFYEKQRAIFYIKFILEEYKNE